MALRGDRNVIQDDVTFFMNETGTRGRIVVFDTTVTGLGAAMDSSKAVVKKAAVAAGSGEYPAGLLLCDVVNKDLSQTHLDSAKDEVQLGSKVTIMKHGWVVSNVLATGCIPTPGLPAYFHTGGELSTTNVSGASTRIGTWLGGKDSDGYAKIQVDIV